MNSRIELLRENIVKLKVDGIVNAANSSLLGGGGVDGAIHRAAGPALLQACRKLNGCKTGEANITEGFLLPAKFIIHTVGPVWQGGNHNESGLLKSCYVKSLQLAIQYQIQTIAFPNISTGVYGFPKKQACGVAINAVEEILASNTSIQKVFFVCFDDDNYALYEKTLQGQH